MVTVRTYWSLAQAALEKSVLENYEIPCALLDENSSVYSEGAQFAVPIRLIVDESQAIRALHILNSDFEKADELEAGEAEEGSDEAEIPELNRNPWELLALAFCFFVPAICLILTKFPGEIGGRWGGYMIARVTIAKFLSWIGVLFAAGLIVLYFLVRRASERDSARNRLQQMP